MSHELRTPLNAIISAQRRLRWRSGGRRAARMKDGLSTFCHDSMIDEGAQIIGEGVFAADADGPANATLRRWRLPSRHDRRDALAHEAPLQQLGKDGLARLNLSRFRSPHFA
jgi:signal transduction histidine kinase